VHGILQTMRRMWLLRMRQYAQVACFSTSKTPGYVRVWLHNHFGEVRLAAVLQAEVVDAALPAAAVALAYTLRIRFL
jgi:hypothetical protein